jgi:hypothetical protein
MKTFFQNKIRTEKKNYNQDNRKKFGAHSSMALVPFSEMGH